MADETNPAPEDAAAPAADQPKATAPAKQPQQQPRMKAIGQRSSKERGAHTHHKKNPGKRPKKGGS